MGSVYRVGVLPHSQHFAVKLQVPKFFGISAQIIPKLCNKLILDNAKIFETFNSLTELKILMIFDDFNDKSTKG